MTVIDAIRRVRGLEMKSDRLLLHCLIVSLILPVALSSCGGGPGAGPARQVLHLGNGAEPKDLDPAIVTGMLEFHIIQAVLEGLTALDPSTLQPIPAAAEVWEVSTDRLTYTFHMRTSARWSNGDPVTADDFIYSWTRLLAPATAAEYAYQAHYIKNGKAYNEGKLKDPSKLGLSAPDSHTLVVKLESPTPFFLALLNHHALYPVNRRAVEAHGSKWTRPEHHVGNGPFKLKEWEMNQAIAVERNPYYWDSAVVRLDEIRFYPIEDEATEEKQFRAGKLHMTNTVPLERIPYWKDQKEYSAVPSFGTYYYELNVTRGVTKDRRVRRALAMSLDRTALVEKVLRGGQIPAYAFTPPNTAGFTPKPLLRHDTEGARRLLAEAGYPGGKGFPKLDILYNTMEGHRKVAETLQQMWKKELGIDVGLYNQEWKVFLSTKQKLDYEIARAGWWGDYPDPNTFLDMYVTGGGNNHTGWGDRAYDELIEKAARAATMEERRTYFQKCEDLLADDVPIIPLYTYTHPHLKRPEVKGWVLNVMDVRSYKNVWLEPAP